MKNGNGQLEFQQPFGDFVLQLEVFSNGKHLNSGIFFRSIPGEFWQGYESQIQNGYKDGDRTQPIDCGTGGFYRRQNARKVVSNDLRVVSRYPGRLGRPHGRLGQWLPGQRLDRYARRRTRTRATDCG